MPNYVISSDFTHEEVRVALARAFMKYGMVTYRLPSERDK